MYPGFAEQPFHVYVVFEQLLATVLATTAYRANISVRCSDGIAVKIRRS